MSLGGPCARPLLVRGRGALTVHPLTRAHLVPGVSVCPQEAFECPGSLVQDSGKAHRVVVVVVGSY